MQNLRQIVKNYCDIYVTDDNEARRFLEYYHPNFYSDYSDHFEGMDQETIENRFDFIDLLNHWVKIDAPDSYIEIVVEHLYEFYNTNKPY